VRLQGKRVIVTGSSRGLGAAIAEAFWKEGAELLLVARSQTGVDRMRQRLLETNPASSCVYAFRADLQCETAPRDIIRAAQRIWRQIDVVVNNAGVIGPMGMVADNDWALWRKTMQVNLLAPAELCQLAIGWMREIGSGGSIINLSGGGAATPRPYFSAYGTSKCGLVRFSETIAAEVAPLGIRVNCIAPGAMNTEMLQQTLRAGPEIVGQDEYERVVQFAASGGADPNIAADLAVYLASDDSAGINGRLISALWDPWSRLHEYAAEMKNSDVYTLRRIMPEERGKAWSNA
jgi:NAD(P)-dependent dehydrogenase (short-subunit alcohol dehydrogenase family)